LLGRWLLGVMKRGCADEPYLWDGLLVLLEIYMHKCAVAAGLSAGRRSRQRAGKMVCTGKGCGCVAGQRRSHESECEPCTQEWPAVPILVVDPCWTLAAEIARRRLGRRRCGGRRESIVRVDKEAPVIGAIVHRHGVSFRC
jgi:hypothetical protein